MTMRLALGFIFALAIGASGCGPCDNPSSRCLQCGHAGGCLESEEICADDTCTSDEDCDDRFRCSAAGFCEPRVYCD